MLDDAWDTLKILAGENTRESVSQSDAPEMADRLEWVFVDEARSALVDASVGELKQRFREWVRAEQKAGDGVPDSPRYQYFIQADCKSLASIFNNALNQWTPDHVNLIRAWEGEDDVMKIPATAIGAELYAELADEGAWSALYHSGRYDEYLEDDTDYGDERVPGS